MRRGFLVLAAWIVCGAIQLESQAPPPPRAAHPQGPLGALLTPHGHGQPAPSNRPSTPEIVFDATRLGNPLVLDKGWRVGVTANQQAASPDFDDSSWAVRDASDSIADVPDEDRPPGTEGDQRKPPGGSIPDLPQDHKRPFAWYRIHVKLKEGHGPVALLIELPVSHNTSMDLGANGSGQDVDVYANGQLIKPEGPHGDDAVHYLPISRVYDLNVPASETSLTLVVRTLHIPFGYAAYTHFFATRTLRLGNPRRWTGLCDCGPSATCSNAFRD